MCLLSPAFTFTPTPNFSPSPSNQISPEPEADIAPLPALMLVIAMRRRSFEIWPLSAACFSCMGASKKGVSDRVNASLDRAKSVGSVVSPAMIARASSAPVKAPDSRSLSMLRASRAMNLVAGS
jgi:hypothetical protein